MTATPQELDMSEVVEPWRKKPMGPKHSKPQPSQTKAKKNARARARKKLKKGLAITDEALKELYKPIEEWDMEELARGRPRDALFADNQCF